MSKIMIWVGQFDSEADFEKYMAQAASVFQSTYTLYKECIAVKRTVYAVLATHQQVHFIISPKQLYSRSNKK